MNDVEVGEGGFEAARRKHASLMYDEEVRACKGPCAQRMGNRQISGTAWEQPVLFYLLKLLVGFLWATGIVWAAAIACDTCVALRVAGLGRGRFLCKHWT